MFEEAKDIFNSMASFMHGNSFSLQSKNQIQVLIIHPYGFFWFKKKLALACVLSG